jgi:hypothetical protein
MVHSTHELSPSDSPTLALLHPTQEEKIATWRLNGSVWKGAMNLSTYLRREKYLENQGFTRDGGISFWILVDTTAQPNARPILASCESFRKQALIAREDGKVEDIISHGIGSVFCNPAYRNRGYAQRMITELGKKLDTHQQEEGRKAYFTVLYSDIGKRFYSRMHWEAFPSSHIALPPSTTQKAHSATIQSRPLLAGDLAKLCSLDDQWLRDSISKPANIPSIRVALIPDIKTMQWHHAREEFAGREMLGKDPDIKGAYSTTVNGDQVWCIWTRTFGSTADGNTLNILRFIIEGEQLVRQNENDPIVLEPSDQAKARAGAAVLRAAQEEAARWEMGNVQIWNPTPLTVLAAKEVEPGAQVIHRDEESIASLRWHGVKADRSKVQWVGNEKYGWC